MLLQDKVVVVSGVGPGLGRSIAVQCARQGADIVLASRTESRLTEVAKEVTDLGRPRTANGWLRRRWTRSARWTRW
jgi:NAD(P)-dependent dehydrogenase (short-subunit alcohol dehydrogenase family)